MGRRWSRVLRPAAVGVGALALTVGVLGAGAGVAGASHHVKSVYKYAKYVGGHGKANKKLSPITIGVVNQQTSTNAVAPVWTTGVKVAVRYVNQHTGGVDGHPLRAVYCAIPTTVSSATKCGQQFANDPKISAVVGGAIDVGNTALESALKPEKKPVFFGVGISTATDSYPYGFILYGDATHIQAPMATFAEKFLHAKSVSIVYPSNIPGNVLSANIIDKALKYDGVKTVYKVGFTVAVSNLTEPFEAAHAGQTTLFIGAYSGGPVCSNTYLTLKSLGLVTKTKVLMNVPCDTPTVAKADGGTLPHDWYYLTANPLPGSPTKAVTAAERVFKKYGQASIGENAWSADAFGQVLTVAKLDTELLKAHKKVTPATVTAKARKFKGPVVQGAPHLDCGGFTGAPAVCNDLDRFFENTKPNFMKPIGGWIGPPKGFKVALNTTT